MLLRFSDLYISWHHFYESNGVCLVVLQCTDHYTGALMNGFCTHNRNHQKENNPSSSCCWPKRNNRYHASSFKPPTALMMMTILGAFINYINNIIKWISLFVLTDGRSCKQNFTTPTKRLINKQQQYFNTSKLQQSSLEKQWFDPEHILGKGYCSSRAYDG